MLPPSDEQVFEDLKSPQYRDVDWNNLPILESTPDIYEVKGCQHARRVFLDPEGEVMPDKTQVTRQHFSVDEEYSTREEAEKQVQRMKDPSSRWMRENLVYDHHHWPMPSMDYHGPIIPETIEIQALKASLAIDLHIMAELRRDALERKNKSESGN